MKRKKREKKEGKRKNREMMMMMRREGLGSYRSGPRGKTDYEQVEIETENTKCPRLRNNMWVWKMETGEPRVEGRERNDDNDKEEESEGCDDMGDLGIAVPF